ncbi:hypothetical protein GL982_10395 (plasmid) [Spiroplasma citri]|nr:hypothetical protein [Spiroplasma citri]QIA73953.1 hypothetical protein GL982_10395 [Spiroplasma citri]
MAILIYELTHFNFTSRVSKINEIEQGADIWLNYHQSDSGFIFNFNLYQR